jgi:hypothetical protein
MSSNMRLQPILTAWGSLKTCAHEFSRVCFVDETDPDLLLSYNRLDRLVDDYIRRVRVFFNNSRPSSKQTALPISVSISKAADSVSAHWHVFIESFLHVAASNVAPLYAHLSDRLTFIAQMLQGLVNAYDRPHPLIAIRPIRRAQSHLDVLKLEAMRLATECTEPGHAGFDLSAHRASCVALAEKVHKLFPDVFPNNSVTLGSAVATKRDLLVACDNTVAICDAIQLFDQMFGTVSDAMVAVGSAFRVLSDDLKITRHTETATVPVATPESTAAGPVGRIRARLMPMETDIGDPSKLNVPK